MARATVAVGKSKAMSSSRGKAKGTRNKLARKGVGGNKRKEEEEKEDVEDPDDAIDAVDNNSDDSDYQEEGGDSIGESNEDSDDSDSDFETSAKRKQKKSLPPPPKTSAKKDSGQHNRGTGSNKQGSTAGGGAGPLSNGDGKAASGVAVEKETMTYVWEIAKTSRAMCRRCDEKISKGALKIGVVTEGTWGPSTQWHHLQCTVFRITRPEDIVGFSDLDDALLPLLEEQILKSQGMVDDMYEPITPGDLVRKEWSEKAECPHEIMATLLPYQAEGLAWMLNQEKLDYKGGILADEMGMGKTLQAICTIVANRPKGRGRDKVMQQRWDKAEMDMGVKGASPQKRGGTLVVCPTIALKQWQSELARFVKPGILKVVIHHGPNRATLAEDLMKADVILTTYAIVENEHRKAFASDKIACPDCGRSLYPDKMFVHRKYFCGADAKMTEAQAKTQRKGGMAPWRRKDPKGKVKTGVIDTDSEDDMTEVKGRGRRGTTKVNVRVKATKVVSRPKEDGHKTDSAEEGQTDIRPPSKRRKSSKKGVSNGKGSGGRNLEGTTDVSGRGGKGLRRAGGRGKGKTRKGAKGKGVKRKKAAGESESDWSDGGTESSDDETGNSDKEKAFAKVLRDMMVQKRDAEPGVLQEISWQRIVLDEAHMIKDRSTSTAKAIFALTSLFKWCLTGTPLQNRVGELYSLVRFLRMDPHAYYSCRKSGCDCKSLNYRFGPEWRACEECGHTPMMHFAYFNRHILNPISRTGYVGEGKKAFLRLKREVLDQILLRRTKVNRSSDICLPPRIVRVRQHRLDEREEDFYQALYTQSQAQFDTYIDSGTILNNYAHIFDILIRLRQAVDHPYLVIYSSTRREGMTPAITSPTPPLPNGTPCRVDNQRGNGPLGTSSDSDEDDCGICSEPAERPVSAACGHSFCRACVQELIETAPGDIKCPSCSAPLTVDLSSDGRATGCGSTKGGIKGKGVRKDKGTEKSSMTSPSAGGFGSKRFVTKHSVMNRIDLTKFQSSTKMEALMEEVRIMEDRDPAAKAIVFSQFVNMLDLIEYRMHKGQVGCRKLSGHLSIDQRDQVLRAFQTDPGVKVLLISLKAGGVALNLTVANHIFLMDPWWNPAAEMQAIDRTHRLGQFKPIYATRFIIEDTVEERIIKLQEKKQLVFDSTVGGSAESTGKLTVDDLRFLFSH